MFQLVPNIYGNVAPNTIVFSQPPLKWKSLRHLPQLPPAASSPSPRTDEISSQDVWNFPKIGFHIFHVGGTPILGDLHLEEIYGFGDPPF